MKHLLSVSLLLGLLAFHADASSRYNQSSYGNQPKPNRQNAFTTNPNSSFGSAGNYSGPSSTASSRSSSPSSPRNYSPELTSLDDQKSSAPAENDPYKLAKKEFKHTKKDLKESFKQLKYILECLKDEIKFLDESRENLEDFDSKIKDSSSQNLNLYRQSLEVAFAEGMRRVTMLADELDDFNDARINNEQLLRSKQAERDLAKSTP